MTLESIRVVSSDLQFEVSEDATFVFQVVAATSAGSVNNERFEVTSDGVTSPTTREIPGPHGGRLHLVQAAVGRLRVSYRAELDVAGARPLDRPLTDPGDHALDASVAYSEVLYRRPSRYCPTDRIQGFATSEFGAVGEGFERVQAIVEWIRRRIEYLPGSGTVRDSAEDTLLTGMGTCRDFAHLSVALCRAVGIPARFTAVYAPGLTPMDFHAVFEARQDGRWCVFDATGLAPRAAMVRIVTGRDAADAAFASVEQGTAQLDSIDVSAVVGGSSLPGDDLVQLIELA